MPKLHFFLISYKKILLTDRNIKGKVFKDYIQHIEKNVIRNQYEIEYKTSFIR